MCSNQDISIGSVRTDMKIKENLLDQEIDSPRIWQKKNFEEVQVLGQFQVANKTK